MSSRLAVVVAAVALSLGSLAVPVATADPGLVYVITASGDVRCSIDTERGDEVACQSQGGIGFSQAPVYPEFDGARGNLAIVNAAGEFSWEFGDISSRGDDITLDCGQIYHFLGWTILPTSDGTRFTSDRTGRGMFVSVDNVESF